jgi:hypothetical protein
MEILAQLPPPYGHAYSAVRRALGAGDTSAAGAAAEKVIGYAPQFDEPPREERESA